MTCTELVALMNARFDARKDYFANAFWCEDFPAMCDEWDRRDAVKACAEVIEGEIASQDEVVK